MFEVKRFEINLVDHRGDVLLHVNPRLLDRQLILNAGFKGNWGWGFEERYSINLKRGQRFGVIILITPESFMVRSNSIQYLCLIFFLRLLLTINILQPFNIEYLVIHLTQLQ